MDNIKFIEDSHRYILESTGEDLISVSKFTDRFKEKQDWNLIAQRSAIKLSKQGVPVSAQEVLKKWENKRNKSAEIGTLFHYIKESELVKEDNPIFYDRVCEKKLGSYYDGHKNSFPINQLENNTVYPELMIYDLEYMICGQSDKVIVVDGKINIWDYKTDQEITFKGYSNKWMKARTLLPPVSHIEECNGNIYSIKMSLYMYMLWKANNGRFKPGEIIIEHYTLERDGENDNIPILEDGRPKILKTELIKLPYRKKEVMAMLKTLKVKI